MAWADERVLLEEIKRLYLRLRTLKPTDPDYERPEQEMRAMSNKYRAITHGQKE